MNISEIKEILTNVFVDEFEVDENVIIDDANMKDSLGLDSLDYVDLVVIIESNFGVKLVEADFSGINSFNDFYNLIQNKIQLKN